jgi:hypothetical protein
MEVCSMYPTVEPLSEPYDLVVWGDSGWHVETGAFVTAPACSCRPHACWIAGDWPAWLH